MDAPIAAGMVFACLCLGSLAGGAEKMNDGYYYEQFLSDPSSYHLVDDAGNPVSQELKQS